MFSIIELVKCLKNEELVYIQTPDYPEHPALCSAYALQYFFSHFQIKAELVYEGEIRGNSLIRVLDDLDIDILHIDEYEMRAEDKIIIVGGCKGNKNVTDLVGDEVAEIDYHELPPTLKTPFYDIRPEIGSCSTIIYSYFEEQKIPIPKDIATALMLGINIDTSMLTGKVHPLDLQAYSGLFLQCDISFVHSILRNFIKLDDLQYYDYGIANMKIKGEYSYCHFAEGCDPHLLGVLADFFLSLREINFVVVSAQNRNLVHFTVRNEVRRWNASQIIRTVLEGLGVGGGNNFLGGGMIYDASMYFKEEEIYSRLQKALEEYDLEKKPSLALDL